MDRTIAPVKVRAIIDNGVAARLFRGAALFDPIMAALGPSHPIARAAVTIQTALGESAKVRDVMTNLIRCSFLIEPVNEACTSTKFAERWTDRLAEDDPRRADFQTCFDIFSELVAALEKDIDVAKNLDILRLFLAHSLVPYELPVDYVSRGTGANGTPIHTKGNVAWFWDDDFRTLLLLRAYITEHRDQKAIDAIYRLLHGKVDVKTYLTDRAQTGDYKTNREKRWETHPGSPQFALRRDCLRVEYALLEQVTRFVDFPNETKRDLVYRGLVAAGSNVYRCPITLDRLSFPDIIADVDRAIHGKSKFQVGHLNPLKAATTSEQFGHTPKNIGWISDNGNRIQGHLTMAETRALLERIAANYKECGL